MYKANRDAIARAKEEKFLVIAEDVTYEAHELWYLLCIEECTPCVCIHGTKPQRTVTFDTDSVYMHFRQLGKTLIYVPTLTPTERTYKAVERIVKKYAQPQVRARWGGSYIALYGVWESSAVKVAEELLTIWQEAKFFIDQPTLWDSRRIAG